MSLEAPAGVFLGILLSPVLLALVGIFLTERLAREQRESSYVRELVTKHGGAEVVDLSANVTRLNLHLQRLKVLRKWGDASVDTIAFEEKAAFFYYGNFRARAVAIQTHEEVAFARQWLQDAFVLVAAHLLDHLNGGMESDVTVPLEDEAAIFAYFGLEQKRSLLETTVRLGASPALDEFQPLRQAFARFRRRSHGLDVNTVDLASKAMYAITQYSLHGVVPASFGARAGDPPREMPQEMPDGFREELAYFSRKLAGEIWDFMYQRVDGARKAARQGD